MEENRLKIVIDQLLMNPNEFAKSINVSSDTIYNILKGKTKLTTGVKKKIFDKYRNLNRDWFTNGKGDIFLSKEEANDNLYVSEEIEHYTVKDDYNKDRYVKLLLSRIDEQKKTIETYEKCIESLTECIDILKSQGGVKAGTASG